MAKRQIAQTYVDWDSAQWQELALGQFLRKEDEVEYSLEDAQEVYHRSSRQNFLRTTPTDPEPLG